MHDTRLTSGREEATVARLHDRELRSSHNDPSAALAIEGLQLEVGATLL